VVVTGTVVGQDLIVKDLRADAGSVTRTEKVEIKGQLRLEATVRPSQSPTVAGQDLWAHWRWVLQAGDAVFVGRAERPDRKAILAYWGGCSVSVTGACSQSLRMSEPVVVVHTLVVE